MRFGTMKKEVYKHGWSGRGDPRKEKGRFNFVIFSVGCFQWVVRAHGKGLKKGKVIIRIIGNSSDTERVYEMADLVCRQLDKGWIPDKKSLRV